MEHPDEYSVVIKEDKLTAKVGDTVLLKGHVQNHPSVKNLTWQKFHNGKFVPINIHKSKYEGTTTNTPNPNLVLNGTDLGDGGEYRIEVQRTNGIDYSNVCGIEIVHRGDGVFFLSNDGEKKITSRTHDSDVADKLNSHSIEIYRRLPDEDIVLSNEGKVEATQMTHDSDAAEDIKSTSVVHIDCQPDVRKGGTVNIKGTVHFNHSIKYIKWQKYHDGQFVDVDIHNLRYKGSTNALQNPELVINDVDTDDAVGYRLRVQMTESKAYSNEKYIKIIPDTEMPTIEIFSNKQNDQYHVGEDVTIRAVVRNPTAILCMTWQRGPENRSRTINTALPKYKESKSKENEQLLEICNCHENDTGNYFILATCTNNIEDIFSNKIYLDVLEGPPRVTLSHVPDSIFNERVQIRATIRSFPKYTDAIWMKGKEQIDINQPKYKGSLKHVDYSVLCINSLKKEDQSEYLIEITNAFGTKTCRSNLLKVIGDKPIVNLSKSSQSIACGDNITLDAKINSIPPPSSVEWKKDNDIIKADGKKIVLEIEDKYNQKLCIYCLEFADSGKYSISVENALGTTKDQLDIKQPTRFSSRVQ